VRVFCRIFFACSKTHLQLPLKLNTVVMDDHHGLDEGKHTQTEESLSREGTRDGEHQPILLYVHVSVTVC